MSLAEEGHPAARLLVSRSLFSAGGHLRPQNLRPVGVNLSSVMRRTELPSNSRARLSPMRKSQSLFVFLLWRTQTQLGSGSRAHLGLGGGIFPPLVCLAHGQKAVCGFSFSCVRPWANGDSCLALIAF